MFLSDFSIRRPVTATMMAGALLVFGVIGLSRLGISLFPDVDFPIVTVSTAWENARPEEVDNEVTDELEDAISTVSGIKHITSRSMQGLSFITIEFELGKDVDVAAQEVRDKVSGRVGRLPEEAEVPVVDKLDINAQPIIWLAVTGKQAIETLTKVADEQLRPLLQKIRGVGEVRVGGGREKEIHLWIDRDRLAAYDIGVEEVVAAVRRQHVELPGGTIESRDKEFLVRTVGEFETARAMNELIVAFREGVPIRIRDLGRAEAGRELNRPVARFTTGERAEKSVGLGVAPRSGANEVAIATAVKRTLPELRQVLPPGMDIEIASDQTVFIEQSIRQIRLQIVIGACMAALVIFVFLQNVRATLITATALPTSLVTTFVFLYLADFTLNNMTLLGLAMAVGLVIDDAIVMQENIFRHRSELGKGPREAAHEGSNEIGFAVLATTVVLLGVFLPVAFMRGIVGRFFSEFALTVAAAVFCSTFVALTVVPMLCSRFLEVRNVRWRGFDAFNRVFDWGVDFYVRSMRFFLRRRLLVVAGAAGALAVGLWVFTLLEKEFTPDEDQSRFLVRMQTPLSYSIEKTDAVLQRLEARLRAMPEIDHFFSVAGFGSGGVTESNKAVMFVTMVPPGERELGQVEVQERVQGILRGMPDVRGSASEISPLGGRARSEDIQLVIQGPRIEGIDRVSRELMQRMEEAGGYVGVTRDLEIGKPEARVRIDRERAAEAGVSVRDVAFAVGALMGGIDVAEFKEGGKSYDIRLRVLERQRLLPGDIEDLWIRTGAGGLQDIESFVDVEIGVGPNVINRMDRRRSATIYANLEGKVLGDAIPEVRAMAGDVVPDAYAIKFSGTAELFEETGAYVAFAFLLAILFTYMILSAQFESFVQPLAIMMGLPMSFVGAFGLLVLVGNSFNMFSMIGLVLLVGLAAKNGILLIDLTNQIRRRGKGLEDALVEAGATRLRPILMTAISTAAGALPVTLGIGAGSESRQPMAVAIAGGILSSTFLTVVVLPVIYSYLDQLGRTRWVVKLKERSLASSADA